MALIKCPECGSDVSTEAAACPKCGYPIKKQEADSNPKPQVSTQPVNQASSKKGSGCGATIFASLAIIVALLVIIGLLAGSCSGSSSGKTDNWNTESWAKSYAQIIVKDNLKAPSTAKFCNTATEMKATNLGGAKWKVTGWVDAQNSFGAMIRSDFEVVLELSSKSATKISCTITKR